MKFLAPFFGSTVRHVFTAAGGFLVAKGVTSPDVAEAAATSLTEITLGGAAFLAGFVPSVLRGILKK
jgi:hypothetical protein